MQEIFVVTEVYQRPPIFSYSKREKSSTEWAHFSTGFPPFLVSHHVLITGLWLERNTSYWSLTTEKADVSEPFLTDPPAWRMLPEQQLVWSGSLRGQQALGSSLKWLSPKEVCGKRKKILSIPMFCLDSTSPHKGDEKKKRAKYRVGRLNTCFFKKALHWLMFKSYTTM